MKYFFVLTLCTFKLHAGLFELEISNNSDQATTYDKFKSKLTAYYNNSLELNKFIGSTSLEEFAILTHQQNLNTNLKIGCLNRLRDTLNNNKKLIQFLNLPGSKLKLFNFDPSLTHEIAHYCVMEKPDIKHRILQKIPLKKKLTNIPTDDWTANLQSDRSQNGIEIEPPDDCRIMAQTIVPSDYKVRWRVGNTQVEVPCYSYHLKEKRSLFAFTCSQGIFLFNTENKKLIWESRRTHFLQELPLIVRIAPIENALFCLFKNQLLKKITVTGTISAELIRENVQQFDLHPDNRYLIVQYADKSSDMISLIDGSSYKMPTRNTIHFAKSRKSDKFGHKLITPYDNPELKFQPKWFPLKKFNSECIDLTKFNQTDDYIHNELSFVHIAVLTYLLNGSKENLPQYRYYKKIFSKLPAPFNTAL